MTLYEIGHVRGILRILSALIQKYYKCVVLLNIFVSSTQVCSRMTAAVTLLSKGNYLLAFSHFTQKFHQIGTL
jgi:hypothetical protein